MLRAESPDVVLHLAAKVGRLFGEEDPAETIADNAGMTALVAQACGERNVRLIYASTSEVYGDLGERVASEGGLTRLPHNIYGLSKRWGEEACRLYAPRGLTTLRFSMPYGPGHPPGRGRAALTNFLHNAMTRQPIEVHAGAERSWCWVGDTARAVRMILELEHEPGVNGDRGAWNVGRDDLKVPMRTVAEMACLMTDAPLSLISEIEPPSRQTVVKRLSTDKLRRIGWEPQVELGEGMERTLAWLKAGFPPLDKEE
jgi:nucleoside-diphosphate-sugar epimerase